MNFFHRAERARSSPNDMTRRVCGRLHTSDLIDMVNAYAPPPSHTMASNGRHGDRPVPVLVCRRCQCDRSESLCDRPCHFRRHDTGDCAYWDGKDEGADAVGISTTGGRAACADDSHSVQTAFGWRDYAGAVYRCTIRGRLCHGPGSFAECRA